MAMSGVAHRFTVAQIGARQHYAVPRAFASIGRLRAFYTDAWCRFGHSLLKHGPSFVRAFAGRYHQELKAATIIDFTFSLAMQRNNPDRYGRYLEIGRRFGQKIRDHLSTLPMDVDRDVFFGFDTGCLEVLEMLNQRRIVSIVDQIDPGRVEEQIVIDERDRWQGWEQDEQRAPEAYWERLGAEWATASIVLVNSQWTRQAMVAQGVPAEKCIVVPMAYEPGPRAQQIANARSKHRRPLTVLWLGQVNLRKGIPYFLEAANLLKDSSTRFVVAGDISISLGADAPVPQNVEFVGRVTRDQTVQWYEQADIFILPTLSDGFAITQLEAMAHGLPVIATPHCGDVVKQGEDGFIVPIRDATGIAERIIELDKDRERLNTMSRAAFAKSKMFTLARYADSVIRSIQELNTLSPVPT